jgi:hypothetical protein
LIEIDAARFRTWSRLCGYSSLVAAAAGVLLFYCLWAAIDSDRSGLRRFSDVRFFNRSRSSFSFSFSRSGENENDYENENEPDLGPLVAAGAVGSMLSVPGF